MIILYEYEWVLLVFNFFDHGICIHLIHLLIVFPIFDPEHMPGVSNMAKRPKAFISKAIIIMVFLFFCKPNATQSIFVFVGRHLYFIMFINSFFIGVTASRRYPQSTTGF